MTALREVVERVEAGSGADRELSRAVMTKIGGWHRVTPTQARNKNGAFISPEDWIGRMSDGSPILDGMHGTTMHRDVPDVVTSVDAVIALIEAKLPGAGWSLDRVADGVVEGDEPFIIATVEEAGIVYPQGCPEGQAPTPARALLAAALRAISHES